MKNYIKLISVFITFIIIIFFVYFKIYSNNKLDTKTFNNNKSYSAKKLYNNIKNSKKYYNNPDELMQTQIDILMLLYGNMVEDKNIYKELIKKQRSLFDQEILKNNSFEAQYNNFLTNLNELKENKILCIKISKNPAVYSNKNSKAQIKVEQIFTKINKIDSIYYLEKFNNNWKIVSWKFIDINKKEKNKKEVN